MPNKPLTNEQTTEALRKMIDGLTPAADCILFRQHSPEEMTEGGLILVDSAREAPQRGTVLKAGADVAPHLGPGEVIHWAAYTPVPIASLWHEPTKTTANICLMKAADVLAIGELKLSDGWRVRREKS